MVRRRLDRFSGDRQYCCHDRHDMDSADSMDRDRKNSGNLQPIQLLELVCRDRFDIASHRSNGLAGETAQADLDSK